MKKNTSFSAKGQRADIGELVINRILPNRYSEAVGSFVFLDHIGPQVLDAVLQNGTGGHPHRGIATLSYIMEGENEHIDSAGHHTKVYSGGIQWMKSGKGILHDETLNPDSRTGTNRIHAFQFWINLPSLVKEENPEYLSIQSEDVPRISLPDNNGWLKLIVGEYENLKSVIPSYSNQFLYHIQLHAGGTFSVNMDENVEVAVFLPTKNTVLNDATFESGEFIEFDRLAGEIQIENPMQEDTDILLFGGEPYREAIVAEGPFVMNSAAGIAEAYRDFYAGKYGEINHQKGKV
jgi:redox-sensitive bicupin YhaK (pirin superfamily)